jgi:glucan biosynthesis protein C
MHSTDRLHALDALRAFALLLGIALHAANPYVADLPGWPTRAEPSDALAGVFYTIHQFRMPLFFLIAGFFGRMLLERRGAAGFVRDRSRRILLPLAAGVPLLMLATVVALVLGKLLAGADAADLAALQPPAAPANRSVPASIHLIHLWFLYYLLMFYAGALAVRATLGRSTRVRTAADAAVSFLTRSVAGPALLAVPIAAYYVELDGWSGWGGFPAPFSLIPDVGALLAYGMFFAFGWLLHRQRPLLTFVERRWPLNLALAVGAWAVCRAIGGATPHWGPYLAGSELVAYTSSYAVGAWCWSFALLGLALRFLSSENAARRYLADASYWMYLMHIPALVFFGALLEPLPWHWAAEYPLSIAGTVVVLLVSYRYLVRYTFIGSILNGRRQRRSDAARQAQPSAAA